jgi:hypothetical protein
MENSIKKLEIDINLEYLHHCDIDNINLSQLVSFKIETREVDLDKKTYSPTNYEKYKEYHLKNRKEHYQKNKDEISAKRKQFYQDNKERLQKKCRERYHVNKTKKEDNSEYDITLFEV